MPKADLDFIVSVEAALGDVTPNGASVFLNVKSVWSVIFYSYQKNHEFLINLVNFSVFRFLKVNENPQISDSVRYASRDYAEIRRYLLNYRDTKNAMTIIHKGHAHLCKNGFGNLFR